MLFVEVYMNKEILPPWSSLAKTIIINGMYEHYKGFRYKVLAIARHSETLEELVFVHLAPILYRGKRKGATHGPRLVLQCVCLKF